MNNTATKFHQHVSNLHNYWPHFNTVAYAIYNDKDVLLFNHPKCVNNDYITIPKSNDFNACTVILFEDFPTAIVDERLFSEFNQTYAVLIHELFHGYQYTYGESRFPNELVGIDYSLCEKNISLRIEEQNALYQALLTKDLASVHYFITLRNTRNSLFPQETGYEAAIESVEGPAHYVETKAFKTVAANEYEQYIEKTLTLLTEPIESHLQIRKSCYSSGLALCMLLDHFSPNWQHAFTQSQVSLFDLFKSFFQNNEMSITVPDHKQLAEIILHKDQLAKQAKFKQFEQATGYKIVMNGTFKVTSFDPMNITKYNNQAIHHHFIQLTIDDMSYIFTQPVHTTFEQNFMTIYQAILFVDTPPLLEHETITIMNNQLPISQLEQQNDIYYVTI